MPWLSSKLILLPQLLSRDYHHRCFSFVYFWFCFVLRWLFLCFVLSGRWLCCVAQADDPIVETLVCHLDYSLKDQIIHLHCRQDWPLAAHIDSLFKYWLPSMITLPPMWPASSACWSKGTKAIGSGRPEFPELLEAAEVSDNASSPPFLGIISKALL